MGGFKDTEYVVPLSLLAAAIVLCLPVLQLSAALGIALISSTVLLVLAPWFYLERRSRRKLKELLDKNDQLEGDQQVENSPRLRSDA